MAQALNIYLDNNTVTFDFFFRISVSITYRKPTTPYGLNNRWALLQTVTVRYHKTTTTVKWRN